MKKLHKSKDKISKMELLKEDKKNSSKKKLTSRQRG